MDFSLAEICSLLADKIEVYNEVAKKRRIQRAIISSKRQKLNIAVHSPKNLKNDGKKIFASTPIPMPAIEKLSVQKVNLFSAAKTLPWNTPKKLKGQKRLPVTWSPDIDLKRSAFQSTIRTPPKNTPGRNSPPDLGVTLRSTPRKRLLFGDVERVPLTPEKIDFSDISTPQKFKINSPIKGTPPIKRSRLDRTFYGEFKGPLDNALKGLSPTQLIHMIKRITYKHPEVEEEIRKEMPTPDLSPLEEKLCYLKSNVFKSLPTSRLTSKTDSPAYSRVATHLAAFKKCVVDQGKVLVDSQHWESVIKYVFLAWSYVKATPVWDNQPHNAHRKQCFKALTYFCMTALKKGAFDKDFMADVQDKLQGMEVDSEDIQTCLKYVIGYLRDN